MLNLQKQHILDFISHFQTRSALSGDADLASRLENLMNQIDNNNLDTTTALEAIDCLRRARLEEFAEYLTRSIIQSGSIDIVDQYSRLFGRKIPGFFDEAVNAMLDSFAIKAYSSQMVGFLVQVMRTESSSPQCSSDAIRVLFTERCMITIAFYHPTIPRAEVEWISDGTGTPPPIDYCELDYIHREWRVAAMDDSC